MSHAGERGHGERPPIRGVLRLDQRLSVGYTLKSN